MRLEAPQRGRQCAKGSLPLFLLALFLAHGAAAGCIGAEPRSRNSAQGAAIDASVAALPPLPRDPERGELIVCLQGNRSNVEETFRRELLPALTRAAHAEGVPTTVLELGNRAPTEVSITPLCVFQNQYGRSVYQGRTTTPDRLRTFLRVARWVPQEDVPLIRQDAALIEKGRAQVALSVKVTALAGSVPEGHSAQEFESAARAAAFAGLKGTRRVAEVGLARAGRTFYLDFYPYRSPENRLFVATALYSQFHCEIPIADHKTSPEEGDFASAAEVFKRAASGLEADVARAMADGRGGDGFDALPATVAEATWDALGYALPARGAFHRFAADAAAKIPRLWQTSGEQSLLFQFAAPLDLYAGEAKSVAATLEFDSELTLASLKGEVIVATAQVTMGDPILDQVIAGSTVLGSDPFPEASFRVVRVISGAAALPRTGEEAALEVEGDFTLKGQTRRLTTRAVFEASFDGAGQERLYLRGSFVVPLKEVFGISGPEGPSPARDTLHIYYRLAFAPAKEISQAVRGGASQRDVQNAR